MSQTSSPELVSPAVSVHCPEQPEARRLSKRLPGTMTVQKLKGLLQRVYRVDVADQRLTYLDSTVRTPHSMVRTPHSMDIHRAA